MKFAELDTDAVTLVDAYDDGQIRIRGRAYTSAILVSAEGGVTDWGPPGPQARLGPAELKPEHLEPALAMRPQVLIIGTGRRQQFPDPAVYFALLEQGIGVEVMDTGAACRTYNILAGEGRRVVAALMLD